VMTKLLGRAVDELEKDIKESLAAIADLKNEMLQFGDILKSIRFQTKRRGGHQELPASNDYFKEGQVIAHLEAFRNLIRRIAEHLKWLKDADICRMLKIQERTQERLKRNLADLIEQDISLKIMADAYINPNQIITYDTFLRHWTLLSRPVDVSNLIRENLYRDTKGLVYTSATICMDGNYETFRQILGMDRPFFLNKETKLIREFRHVFLGTPFSSDRIEMIVPTESVSGDYSNKSVWMNTIIKILPELVKKNRGRTLVLFSSYQDLETVAKNIGNDIIEAGFPLLIQRNGYPTGDLCDEFRAVKESVLFGVDTFWYGVDFKGDTLTQVVITRIPYPHSADALNMARKKIMHPAKYMDRYLYDTYIKMKQGIGRLIRCETDHGKVIVLDSRFLRLKDKFFKGGENKIYALCEVVDQKDQIQTLFSEHINKQVDEPYIYQCGKCGEEISADAIACPTCEQKFKETINPLFQIPNRVHLEFHKDPDCSIQKELPVAIHQFIEEMCVIDEKAQERGRALHQVYKKWHIEKCGYERHLSRRYFWDFIAKHETIRTTSNNPRIFSGIRLKNVPSNIRQTLSAESFNKDYDLSQIRELVLNIGNTGINKDQLIDFFQHPDYEVRRRACSAAKKLHDKEIVKYIGPCLHAPEPQVRQYALKAVISSRCYYVNDLIEKLSKTEDKEYNVILCKRILKEIEAWNPIEDTGQGRQIVTSKYDFP